MSLPEIIIHCDGACFGNPGPGGFAAVLILKNAPQKEKIIAGFEQHTTNNRMELRAVIEAIKTLKRQCRVELFSDSQYVIKGMNQWMASWKKNNFKNSHNKIIANADLWQDLLNISNHHEISWHWVRGHSGDELNERVDEIAKEQASLAMHQALSRS